MEKLHLYLVRHGESQGNATGDYSTLASDALSPRGLEQAQHLARYLADFSFDHMVVSPLQRALQTIAPYLEAQDRRAEIWPEVNEVPFYGDRDAVIDTWTPAPAERYPGLPDRYDFYNGEAVKPAPQEPLGQGLYRVRVAAQRLMAMRGNEPRRILVVSHGHFLRELLNHFFGLERMVFFQHRNCGISALTLGDDWIAEYINVPTGPHSTRH